MIAYASRTGTKRNLAALRAAGWRLLVSATGSLRAEGFQYALDNGAWTAYQQRHPFDVKRFEVALARMGAGADWTVVPDVVAGGLESLRFSLSWLPRVLAASPLALLAVQDGMAVDDVLPHIVGGRTGIFVGGSTEWKLRTIDEWAGVGRLAGCWVHVGRVNSARRISACAVAGVTSFDGTSASRYSVTLSHLDSARRQLAFAR